MSKLAAGLDNKITLIASYGERSEPGFCIGLGINAKYARPAGVTITSIAVNNKAHFLDFHIFVSSIAIEDLDRLKELNNQYAQIVIKVYQVDEAIVAHLPTQGHFPLPIYFRVFMPLIINYDKILYLDSDILCNRDISSLINLNMNNYPVAVVPDVPATALKQINKHGIKTSCYFNSGVMLINRNMWLKLQITEKLLAIFSQSRARNFTLFDQDALNEIIGEQKIILSTSWNYINITGQTDLAGEVVFLHCAARPKPWEIACDPNSLVQGMYKHYEQLSPWQGLPLLAPQTSSDARIYAENLFSRGEYLKGARWYCRYLKAKLN